MRKKESKEAIYKVSDRIITTILCIIILLAASACFLRYYAVDISIMLFPRVIDKSRTEQMYKGRTRRRIELLNAGVLSCDVSERDPRFGGSN